MVTNTPINVKDATAATLPLRAYKDGTDYIPIHTLLEPLIVDGSTLTRPADTTAYAFGDLVANSTTAGSVTPGTIAAARGNDLPGTALRMRLQKSGATITNAIFRVHLYNSSPTVTNGDNGAWVSTQSGYIGSFDVTIDKAFSSGSIGIGVPTIGSTLAFVPASGATTLYYLIEARAAYTPASGETFTPTLEVA
jgi:hypothetical protein